jgi:hypothetical protein
MPSKKVRVLVGTRKGGYVVESDTSRRKWKVASRVETGWDVFHMAADPRKPGDLYACVNTWMYGPMLMRSTDYGKKWKEVGTPMMTVSKSRPPRFDPDHPEAPAPERAIANLWHIEPGPESEPKTLFLGVDPYSIYRSDDSGETWQPLPGLNEHPTKAKWNPGNGGPCLHTILLDPTRPRRMYAGISAAGFFRSDDGGETWTPKNKGVEVPFQPEKYPEFGQCVHKVTIDAENPNTLYRQDHGGMYVSRDAGDSWIRIGKSLPLDDDFGFVVATAPHLPGRAMFVPLEGNRRLTFGGGFRVYQWQEKAKKFSALMPTSRFPGDFGNHREALACDRLDPAGIYAGTTTGQLFFSPNAGKSWDVAPFTFPAIHSVAVANPG